MLSLFQTDIGNLENDLDTSGIIPKEYPTGKKTIQFDGMGKGWNSKCGACAVLNAAEIQKQNPKIKAGDLYDLARQLRPPYKNLPGSYLDSNLEGYCQIIGNGTKWTKLAYRNENDPSYPNTPLVSANSSFRADELIISWLQSIGPVIMNMKWFDGYQTRTFINKIMVPMPYEMPPGWISHSVVAVGIKKTRRFFWQDKTWHLEVESSTWSDFGNRSTGFLPISRLNTDIIEAYALIPA